MRSLVPAYLSRFPRIVTHAAAWTLCIVFVTSPAAADQIASRKSIGLGLIGPNPTVGIFGALEVAIGKPEDVRQWDDFKRRYEGEQSILEDCIASSAKCPSDRARKWSDFIAGEKGKERQAQIEAVNHFVNGIARHDSDANVFGIRDYWATPLEFLERTGDCEDFTILKFVSLLHLGFANEEMRIVIALDRTRNIGHAVLAVREGKDEEILDTSYEAIWPASLIADYAPEYSLNLTTRWAHFPAADSAAQLLAQSQQQHQPAN